MEIDMDLFDDLQETLQLVRIYLSETGLALDFDLYKEIADLIDKLDDVQEGKYTYLPIDPN